MRCSENGWRQIGESLHHTRHRPCIRIYKIFMYIIFISLCYYFESINWFFSFSHTRTLRAHTCTHSLTGTHTHTPSHANTDALTHTHTHSLSHTLYLSLYLSLNIYIYIYNTNARSVFARPRVWRSRRQQR